MFAARNMTFAKSAGDPLAGISFLIRLQTHNGNNVPLGLYQDSACTTPATADGDPIGGWRDELGTSGLVATSSGTARPLLKFVSGVPVVRFDGTNDFLVATVSTVTSAILAHYAGHSRSVIDSSEIPFSLDDGVNNNFSDIGLAIVGRDGSGNFGSYRGNINFPGASFASGKHIQTNIWDGSLVTNYVDGAGSSPGSAPWNFSFTKIRIGAGYYSGAVNAFAPQDVSSLLIRTSTADRTIIESYLATI